MPPWKLSQSEIVLWRPVATRASWMAALMAVAPLVVNRTRDRSPGARSARRRARSIAALLDVPLPHADGLDLLHETLAVG